MHYEIVNCIGILASWTLPDPIHSLSTNVYAVVKLMMGGVVADIDIGEDRRAVITPKKIGEILVYMKSCKN